MAQESCNLDKKEEAAEIIKPASPRSLFMNSSTNSIQEFTAKKPNKAEGKPIKEAEEKEESLKAKTSSLRVGNRCLSCRKRVGLTGFRCRCGELFCWKHRYSDIHDCSFDYKAFGRQEISKANPLVRAAKIIKI